MKSYVDAKYSSFRLNEIFSLKHSYSLYLIQPFCEPEYLSSESKNFFEMEYQYSCIQIQWFFFTDTFLLARYCFGDMESVEFRTIIMFKLQGLYSVLLVLNWNEGLGSEGGRAPTGQTAGGKAVPAPEGQ